jgi:hypothetical protein
MALGDADPRRWSLPKAFLAEIISGGFINQSHFGCSRSFIRMQRHNIAAHKRLFRIGMISDLLAATLAIFLVLALYGCSSESTRISLCSG